jgi:hypothetical protein
MSSSACAGSSRTRVEALPATSGLPKEGVILRTLGSEGSRVQYHEHRKDKLRLYQQTSRYEISNTRRSCLYGLNSDTPGLQYGLQRRFQNAQRFLELLVAHDQRHQQANHVSIGARR